MNSSEFCQEVDKLSRMLEPYRASGAPDLMVVTGRGHLRMAEGVGGIREAAPQSDSIYARAGEQVTCENGHVICEVKRDIEKGASQQGNELHRWRDPEPQPGTLTADIKCCRCGAPWAGGVWGALQLHIGGAWRS